MSDSRGRFDHPSERDPLDLLPDAVDAVEVPEGMGLDGVRERGRSRTRRLQAVAGAGLAMIAVAFGLVTLPAVLEPNGDDGVEATVVVSTRVGDLDDAAADIVPAFVAATPGGWSEVVVDGVVDRSGAAAPVYQRLGRDDAIIVVFGESVPCIGGRTCHAEPAPTPGDLGFLAAPGPLADWTVLFLPDLNNDFHLGRAGPTRTPGIEGDQYFFGARNAESAIAATVGSLSPDRVVIAGLGGGGLGALEHLPALSEAFPGARITVLVDGFFVPVRADGDRKGCLGERADRLWGARLTDLSQPGIYADLAAAHPDVRFLLTAHRNDPVLRRYFRLTADDCSLPDGPLTAETYSALVAETEATLAAIPQWRMIVVAGAGHGVLDHPVEHRITERVHDALRQLNQ